MSLSTVLNVILGMVFIYFLLSRFCSLGFEWWVGRFFLRNRYLKFNLQKLLECDALLKDFYKQPLIATLASGEHGPADISPDLFTQVIVNNYTVRPSKVLPEQGQLQREFDLEEIAMGSSALRHMAEKSVTVAQFQASVNIWYSQAMAKSTAQYRHKIQVPMFCLGLFVAIAVNANSIRMMKTFWTEPTISASVALDAQKQITKLALPAGPTKPGDDAKVADSITGLIMSEKTLPIGWTLGPKSNLPKEVQDPGAFLQALLGWIITGLAISFGAPFWFDFLNNIANIKQSSGSASSTGSPAKSTA